MGMSQEKRRKRLRAEAIRRRDQIPPDVRANLSRGIINCVIDWIEMNPVTAVMLYLSMRSEVETDELLDYLLAHSKIVLATVADLKQRTLTPHRITNPRAELVLHPYGMREPNRETCPAFPLEQIDLILVPGAAFDPKGYRIGYGGGFYDRFLPQCPQAVWMGLAYQTQMIADIFPQAWDIPLHHIITENGDVRRET